MKNKILIISSNYPYGKHETFLENEINYMSNFFDIHVLPMYKSKKSDVARKVPKNVTFSSPVLKTNQFKRLLNGLFNKAPLFIKISDITRLFRKSNNITKSLYQVYVNLINFRCLISNRDFLESLNNKREDLIYFYWAFAPVKFIKTNKPIYVRVHGGEIYNDRNYGYVPFENIKFTAENNIMYLPISGISAKYLRRYSQHISYKISRLGVFDRGLNPIKSEKITRIVSCSTLISLKRVHLIIESLALIKDLKIEWIHFGDGPLYKTLLIQSSRLEANIDVIFKGRVSNAELLSFYNNYHIDLFINVSETEGVPVSLMEALSFGIPCFATNVGGTSEIIDESVGSLVNKFFNPKILADYILKTGNSEFISSVRTNARLRWEEIANAEKNYKDLYEIFKSF